MIAEPQLLAQSLVKGERTGLRAAVIDNLTLRDETGHTSDGDDVTVVLLYHAGQELAHRKEVRDRIDLKGLADLGLGLVENRAVITHAGVVYQHCGIAVRRPNLVGDGSDAG